MTPHIEDDMNVVRAASRWLEVLRDRPNLRDEDARAFSEWLAVSPEHVRQYLLMVALEDALDAQSATRHEPVADIVAVGAQHRDPSHGSRFARRSAVAAMCAVVVVLLLAIAARAAQSSADYSTLAGQPRNVTLDDDTHMDLRERSVVKVRFSWRERSVHMLAGEAGFIVQHGLRPFRVEVPGGTIEARGTRFAVALRGESAAVRVTEGSVRLAGRARRNEWIDVNTGERAELRAGGQIGRMTFHKRTLAEIVELFNKQGRPPRFRVEGRAGEQRFGGALYMPEPQTLIEALRGSPDVSIEYQQNVVVIREQANATR